MRFRAWRVSVFVLAFLPVAYWSYLAVTSQLGIDPGKELVDLLGLTALWLLLITLAMTPLKRLSGWYGWLAVRRQLGLWCFAYAVAHVLGYFAFLLGFDLSRLLVELYKRPYIIFGAVAFCGLLLLALTSNQISMRRLGRRWKVLHRAVYGVLFFVLLHMLWVVRADLSEWVVYASVAGGLMALRLQAVGEVFRRLVRSVKSRIEAIVGAI